MSECIVGLCRPRDMIFPLFSWLIRIFSTRIQFNPLKIKYGRHSHAFLRVYNRQTKRWIVIHSAFSGVEITSWKAFTEKYTIKKKWNIKTTPEDNLNLLTWGLDQDFKKYPIRELFGNALQILVKMASLGRLKIKNILGEGEARPRCHELIMIGLRDVLKIDFKGNLDDHDLNYFEDRMDRLFGS